ncbi:MAG TPA: SPFH domain-containing protein [Oceanithermus profundus]|uniref:SPFH domain-containing protein n=1 Tax=Oceanithermus profundus TaxID=187137 RepID=A0A7C4V5Y9_9DEIN|nr:SPFH domain-containing protein [Oceanithermus profundus]
MKQVAEKSAFKINGFAMLLVALALLAFSIWEGWRFFSALALRSDWGALGLSVLAFVVFLVLLPGFFTVQPNQAKVLVFFGKYTGSVRDDGFWWANPFALRHEVSLRVRNFNSDVLKVNDKHGNPIEIGTVVVWQVVDTAKAIFDVDDYEEFVRVQVETAIRALASRYPYDAEEHETSLRGSPDAVAQALTEEVQERLKIAGVRVIEARISHLAYAPEIAQAMLRRQQAQAIISARRLIVDAAVGMVQQALEHLERENVVALDEEKKAAMVNNLMVVLTGDQAASPIINTGTLYG